jgi:hypothetical protein
VTYVTKMKKNLVYTIGCDTMYMSEILLSGKTF